MNHETFWAIIKTAKKNTDGSIQNGKKFFKAHSLNIVTDLASYSESEIIDFHRIYMTLMGKAHRLAMYKLLSIFGYGAGDDYFTWFSSWLIFQGKEIFSAALNNPDELADYLEGCDPYEIINEAYVYIADEAFYKKKENQDSINSKFPSEIHSDYETEEKLNFSNTILLTAEDKKNYPRLYNKYGFPKSISGV